MLTFSMDFLLTEWTDELGDRVFPYDAFLSHNRNDNSTQLAQRLEKGGMRIWHDENADLRDRRVISNVAKALRRSRFVVVCIGPSFNDSVWLKAEYRLALELEKRAKITRVVVATSEGGTSVPSELQHCFRFSPAEPERLEKF